MFLTTPRKLWIVRFVFSESWNKFCWGSINNLVSTPATPSMRWNNPGTIKCCLGHYFSCNYYLDVVISSCKSYKRVAQPRTEPRLISSCFMISDLDYFDCVESLFYKTWLTDWLSEWVSEWLTDQPTPRDPSDLKTANNRYRIHRYIYIDTI